MSGRSRSAASAPIAKRGETRSCWTSASASSVGWLVAVARMPASAIARRRQRQPEPVDERLGPDPQRPERDDRRPELLGGEEDVDEADRDRRRGRPATRGRGASRSDRPGRGQQGEQADQDDERGHAVERREQRDQQDERGAQLRDRVRARQRGAGSGTIGVRSRISAPPPSSKRAIGEGVRRTRGRGVTKHDAAPGVAQRRRAGGAARSRCARSCPNVGSSRTRSRGRGRRARSPTDSRRFSPPDRVNGFASARCDEPQPLEQLVGAPAGAPPRPARPASARGAAPRGPTRVRNWCSGSWKTVPMRRDELARAASARSARGRARPRAPRRRSRVRRAARAGRRAAARASTCRCRSARRWRAPPTIAAGRSTLATASTGAPG